MRDHHPKNWSPEAGCQGKRRFESFTLADEVNKARKYGRSNARRGVYRCPACQGWHIGRRGSLFDRRKDQK